MKLKITLLALFAIISGLTYCQDNKTLVLDGSWMGTISTDKFSLRALLRFEVQKDKVKAYLDSPDQSLKDIPMSKVWTTNDSLFVEASNLKAGIIFKGRFLPGDSVIDGIWGGALPLRLSRTDYVFTLKTNSNPVQDGYKVVKLIESTPFKDQQLSNVCWSFATTSFIETEAIRLGKKHR